MFSKTSKHVACLFTLFVVVSLLGCQHLKNTVMETDEKLVYNESVPIENLERIKLGNSETGEGGSTYDEVMKMMGGQHPADRSEHEENGTSIIEAKWQRDDLGFKFITVTFVNEKAIGKFQKGLK
ncbi:hypothetical protein QNH47_09830 [Virgibacillus halodenitrificans]|uniref:hypothetical protein n=1 Tax=Virgibacillus halodenitrificans TaxID=1482 RepID=UPI0024BF9790|nr:hypothetical protein [Virgibacillus halodenitrificans]WHX24498.1 hypothetical protein QNH47_09830 [Virgibacillus halodenitrificans]